MKAILLATTLTLSAHARLPDAEAWRWVAAIRVAEGNPNYGVLSIKTTDPRRVCFNTVQNTHDRWLRAGRPGAFLTFLARRYCPPSVDLQGHRNWIKNVERSLVRGGAKTPESWLTRTTRNGKPHAPRHRMSPRDQLRVERQSFVRVVARALDLPTPGAAPIQGHLSTL